MRFCLYDNLTIMVKLLGEILIFHRLWLSMEDHKRVSINACFELALGCDKLILTMGTHCDWYSNPGSHTCNRSAVRLSHSRKCVLALYQRSRLWIIMLLDM